MPDWLRAAVWIVGVLALLVTLVVGYLMWLYRIPPRRRSPRERTDPDRGSARSSHDRDS